jgi:hypothetical protein
MDKNKSAWMILTLTGLLSNLSAPAQNWPAPGVYEIVGGEYSECCGFSGEIRYQLPLPRQALIQLSIDPLKGAKLEFLESDGQTSFRVVPCPPGTPVDFVLGHGVIQSNSILFQADPGLPPNQIYSSYTISKTGQGIRLDGLLGTTPRTCPDVPDTFRHTNVVARLLPPRLAIHAMRRESDAIHFGFTVDGPYDYQVEFCDALSSTNWHSLTNFHGGLEAVDVVVVDAATNSPTRFYRVRLQSSPGQ